MMKCFLLRNLFVVSIFIGGGIMSSIATADIDLNEEDFFSDELGGLGSTDNSDLPFKNRAAAASEQQIKKHGGNSGRPKPNFDDAKIASQRSGNTASPSVRGNESVFDGAMNDESTLQYKIGVGDNVRIHVWRNADLSTTVPVRPDGYLSMPLLGDIKASGLKPIELADVIKEKLSSYLRDPRVSVIMLGLSSNEYINRVRVTGAVNRPTSVPFREGMTVLDLILDTGGVSQFAAPNRTKIFRKTNGESQVLKVKLDDILEKADLKTNYAIKPGDVITVPERLF